MDSRKTPKRERDDGVTHINLDPTRADIFGPDELLQIFSYLEQRELIEAMQVCKTWGHIIDTPTLWERLHFANVGRNLFRMEEDMVRVLTKHSGVKEISFSQIPVNFAVDSEFLAPVKKLAPNLLHLEFSGPGRVRQAALTSIEKSFPNLEYLCLKMASYQDGQVELDTPSEITSVSVKHSRLQRLWLDSDSGEKVIVHCEKLRMLRVQTNCAMRRNLRHERSPPSIIECPNLTWLDLSTDAEAVHQAIRGSSKLLYVRSCAAQEVGREAEKHNLASVVNLNVSLCHEDIDLRWVYQLPQLQSFSAVKCPVRTSRNFPVAVAGTVNWHQIRNLPLSFPHLAKLNLEAYSPLVFNARDRNDEESVADHGFADTRDALDLFSPPGVLKQLETLHLDTYQLPKNIDSKALRLQKLTLTECGGIMSLHLDCPSLHTFLLTGCSSLETTSLKLSHAKTIEIRGLNRLRKLSLNARCVKNLRLGCPQLENLNIDRCVVLEKLAFFGCRELQDEEMLSAGRCCTDVRTLTLMDTGVTVAGLREFKYVTRLDVKGHIIKDTPDLYTACPHLTVLNIGSSDDEETSDMPWAHSMGHDLSTGGHLPDLKELVVLNSFGSSAILGVLNECLHLSKVSVTAAKTFPQICLKKLPETQSHVPRLEDFRAYQCRVLLLVSCEPDSVWRSLKKIDLSECDRLSSVTLECPNLESLQIKRSPVEVLWLHCPRLTFIDIRFDGDTFARRPKLVTCRVVADLLQEIHKTLSPLSQSFLGGDDLSSADLQAACTTFTMTHTSKWKSSFLKSLRNCIQAVTIQLSSKTSLHKIAQASDKETLTFGGSDEVLWLHCPRLTFIDIRLDGDTFARRPKIVTCTVVADLLQEIHETLSPLSQPFLGGDDLSSADLQTACTTFTMTHTSEWKSNFLKSLRNCIQAVTIKLSSKISLLKIAQASDKESLAFGIGC